MRILITNDDGIEAPGIQALRRALEPQADILVVAPSRQRSASGHAITMERALYAHHYVYGPNSQGWGVDGTPADCVKIGTELMAKTPPDLLVSGINNGANLGRDVFYSGTVAGAIEGAFQGIPAIAISLDGADYQGYTWAAAFLRWWISSRDFVAPPSTIVYNVNVPSLSRGVPTAMRAVRLGLREYTNHMTQKSDAHQRTYFWLTGRPTGTAEEDGTDVGAHQAQFVTVTPIHLDWTAYPLLDTLPGLSQHIPSIDF